MLPVLVRTTRMALLASLTAGARRRGQQDSGESSSVGASVRRSRSAASLESASAASTASHSARRSCSSGALGARIGGVSVESDRGSQGQGEGLDDSGSDFWAVCAPEANSLWPQPVRQAWHHQCTDSCMLIGSFRTVVFSLFHIATWLPTHPLLLLTRMSLNS